MKLLKDILYKVRIVEVVGTTNTAITAISFDSRKIEKDSLFVAIKQALEKEEQVQHEEVELEY